MKAGITTGQVSDYSGYDAVMHNDLPQPKILLADRGYDSDNVHKDVDQRRGTPIIPARKNRKDPEPIDDFVHALRNLVERCINKLKNARRVATRYEKLPQAIWALSRPSQRGFNSAICQPDL